MLNVVKILKENDCFNVEWCTVYKAVCTCTVSEVSGRTARMWTCITECYTADTSGQTAVKGQNIYEQNTEHHRTELVSLEQMTS